MLFIIFPFQMDYALTLSIKARLATIMPGCFFIGDNNTEPECSRIEAQGTRSGWQLQDSSSLADIVCETRGYVIC